MKNYKQTQLKKAKKVRTKRRHSNKDAREFHRIANLLRSYGGKTKLRRRILDNKYLKFYRYSREEIIQDLEGA